MYPSRFAVAHGAGFDSFGCDLDDLRAPPGFADELAEPVVAARAARSSSTNLGNSVANPYSDHIR
jgi:hypothetical protein